MKHILSNYTASITELKKSPTELLNESGGEEIVILNHNVLKLIKYVIQFVIQNKRSSYGIYTFR